MGIIVLAIGVGGPLGQLAAALHLIAHALSKGVMFCVAGEVTERYHTRSIVRIRGILRAAPLLGALLFAGAFAITGAPPFTVFLSEWLVVQATVTAGHSMVAIVVALLLCGVFAALLVQVARMALGEAPGEALDTTTDRSAHTALRMKATAAEPATSLQTLALPSVALVGARPSADGLAGTRSDLLPPFPSPFLPPGAHGAVAAPDGDRSRSVNPPSTWMTRAQSSQSSAHTAATAASEPTAPTVPDAAGWPERAALSLLLSALVALLIAGFWLPLPVQHWLQAAGALLP